jgi:hypothetical protein
MPKKYYAPLKNPGPKTGRFYAAVVSELRAAIVKMGARQFTWCDLEPFISRSITPIQIRRQLRLLYLSGELTRVSKGMAPQRTYSVYKSSAKALKLAA